MWCWRLTGCFHFKSLGWTRNKLMSGFRTNDAYSRSAKFASQAVEHIRTVASLGRLDAFVDDYLQTLVYPTQVGHRASSNFFG